MGPVPTFRELIARTTSSAIHLEMRDSHTPGDPRFRKWVAGEPFERPVNPAWVELVREHAAQGCGFGGRGSCPNR